MASVFKRKAGLAAPRWYIKYRDAQGRVRRVAGGKDRAATLRTFLPTRSPFQPVWAGAWRPLAAPMLRADLEAAGVPVEVDGRIADFHALRVTFITGLSRAGVHPRTAMELVSMIVPSAPGMIGG